MFESLVIYLFIFSADLWLSVHLCLQQTIVAEHEIRNISCAAQDPDDLCTFAYITKDSKSGHHFCHVFSTVEVVRNQTHKRSTADHIS